MRFEIGLGLAATAWPATATAPVRTIVATAREPLGGETTVIALDAELAGSGRIPALDLAASGTVRPELLVGEKGAEAIAEARAAAIAGWLAAAYAG